MLHTHFVVNTIYYIPLWFQYKYNISGLIEWGWSSCTTILSSKLYVSRIVQRWTYLSAISIVKYLFLTVVLELKAKASTGCHSKSKLSEWSPPGRHKYQHKYVSFNPFIAFVINILPSGKSLKNKHARSLRRY